MIYHNNEHIMSFSPPFKAVFEPCYPPWMPEFSLITVALWEQYKPKSEHGEPYVFIRVLDPGNKNARRKFTIDNRKF